MMMTRVILIRIQIPKVMIKMQPNLNSIPLSPSLVSPELTMNDYLSSSLTCAYLGASI